MCRSGPWEAVGSSPCSVFAESFGNQLVISNPTLHLPGLVDPTMRMMQMSGTSVATPIAVGAAALMFQINPKLTPNMIKALMQYSPQNWIVLALWNKGVACYLAARLNGETRHDAMAIGALMNARS